MSDKRALVLDGRTLSSLAVIRSLGRQGYTCDVGETFRWNLCRFSKYVDEAFTYPDAEEHPEEFHTAILSRLHVHDYDVVIPTRDATTLSVAKRQADLNDITNTYLAPATTIERFLDKAETLKLAKEAGIPIPPTWFPEETDIETMKSEVEYPALIRARRSSGSRGIRRVDAPSEFEENYESVANEYGTPFVQKYIDKQGYTTACILLDDDSDAIATFSYERIKEYPLSGGPTVVGKSTFDDEAIEAAVKLLQAGDWYGPAEVEFILDDNREARLLEVNPRFWMPVQLAISSGVDYPWYVARLAQGNEVKTSREYTIGQMYHWILPNEMLHTLACGHLLRGTVDILGSIGNKSCYGVMSKNDPTATLGAVAQSLSFVSDKKKRNSFLNRGS